MLPTAPPAVVQVVEAPHLTPLERWLRRPMTRYIVHRESRGKCHVVNPSPGRAAGKFQIQTATWRANGGLRFAPFADHTSCWHQNVVAFRLFLRRGYQPWTL